MTLAQQAEPEQQKIRLNEEKEEFKRREAEIEKQMMQSEEERRAMSSRIQELEEKMNQLSGATGVTEEAKLPPLPPKLKPRLTTPPPTEPPPLVIEFSLASKIDDQNTKMN